MALSSSQLAQRREKKNLARKDKGKQTAQMSQLDNIHAWPIVSAYAPSGENCKRYTMTHVLVVRCNALGKYAVGVFLIDMLLLGVKDAFIKLVPPYHLQSFIDKVSENSSAEEVSPSYVATFIHDAIKYAKTLD